LRLASSGFGLAEADGFSRVECQMARLFVMAGMSHPLVRMLPWLLYSGRRHAQLVGGQVVGVLGLESGCPGEDKRESGVARRLS